MRTIPSSLDSKFKKLVQAESTKAAPAVDLWISRPVVPLVNDYFLEQQAIGNGNNVTALDIAVAHPRHRRQSTKIYIATVENGVAKVVSSPFRQAMETHVWTDCGFSESAEDVAVAFDAVMKNDTRGRSEFVTDREPWVFWVNDGALYGRDLGSGETLKLAETNCTKCTAIRSFGNALATDFDYGLCLFFLLNGSIYVRQRINGKWMDAEPVSFGPSVTWKDIAVSRSWDYRVVLQAMATDGTVYELFTQFMGIGQRGTEHINVKASASGKLTATGYYDTGKAEHLDLTTTASGSLIYGLSSMPVSAFNIADEEDNWGKFVVVRLDYPVTMVSGNGGAFSLFDSNGVEYRGVTSEASEDGLSVTISFTDINNAFGECSLRYTPGTVQSPATAMEAWSVSFLPVNLVPADVKAPTVVEVWNE